MTLNQKYQQLLKDAKSDQPGAREELRDLVQQGLDTMAAYEPEGQPLVIHPGDEVVLEEEDFETEVTDEDQQPVEHRVRDVPQEQFA